MALSGELNPKSKAGNCYSLTVICILTGYTFYIPLMSRAASEVVQVYVDN